MEKIVTLPWPHKDLSSNSRAHWAAKARAVKDARFMAEMAALEAPKVAKMPDAQIFIEYYPKARRGDVHNVPASLKAYIDGIADAMRCDDRNFRIDYPSQWAGTDKNGRVVFRILPAIRGQIS